MLNFNLRGKRGFTLFTALVGFIVIGITVLVMQHLDNSEANYSKIFTTVQSQTELNTLKDILRLDSYSFVSLVLVKKMAEYFDATDSTDNLYILDINKSWSDQTQTFEKVKFIGTNESSPVANFFTNVYITQMEHFSGDYKIAYRFFIYDPTQMVGSNVVDLYNLDTIPNLQSSTTTDTVHKAIQNSTEGGARLLELVDCDKSGSGVTPNSCKNGSFYIPIDLSNLSDVGEYEKILRIMIYRYIDQASVDDAILPRNKTTIYVPLRIFGAISSFLETIKDFEAKEFINSKFRDLYVGDCKSECWTNSNDIKCYTGQLGETDCDIDVSLPGINTKFTFNKSNSNPTSLSRENIKSAMQTVLEDKFNNIAYHKGLTDVSFVDDDFEFTLNFGEAEFYKTISATDFSLVEFPCNYLDNIVISFKIKDESSIFTFGNAIEYNFSVELDNREYARGKSAIPFNPLTGATTKNCVYETVSPTSGTLTLVS